MKTFFLFFFFLLAIPGSVAFSQDAGIKKYGYVAFADPVHHKYPIDTKKHIIVAWAFIHNKAHAAKYSRSERKEMLQRIRDAAKAQGIHLKK
jgi:hypothetical protein